VHHLRVYQRHRVLSSSPVHVNTSPMSCVNNIVGPYGPRSSTGAAPPGSAGHQPADSPSIPAYFSGQPSCVGCVTPPPAPGPAGATKPTQANQDTDG